MKKAKILILSTILALTATPALAARSMYYWNFDIRDVIQAWVRYTVVNNESNIAGISGRKAATYHVIVTNLSPYWRQLAGQYEYFDTAYHSEFFVQLMGLDGYSS